jgi:hypothetical protein
VSEPIENILPTAPNPVNRVIGVIYSALSELNIQLPKGEHVEQSLSTALFGVGGRLDSLALANFIVIAEEKLEAAFGYHLDLTQDDPFSLGTGHFQTVQSLVGYISPSAAGEILRNHLTHYYYARGVRPGGKANIREATIHSFRQGKIS